MSPWWQAHSALHPDGAQLSLIIDRLWSPMFAAAAAIFALVAGALGWALLRRRAAAEAPDGPGRERGMRWTVSLATACTVAVLLVLLGLDISVSRATSAAPGRDALRVVVIGHQWWWEIRYGDTTSDRGVVTANEIHVPVGRPVIVQLKSDDVIHSLWVPSLAGKKDLIPGRTAVMTFRADQPGLYRGQCAEFCGLQHAFMAFNVHAEPPEQFEAWRKQQLTPPAPPADAGALRGQAVFQSSSCAMCHAVAGTLAGAQHAPDLSHVASRQTLAAGTLPNTPAQLAAWIADPQKFKPGTTMPATPLSGEDLAALVAYLGTLK